MSPPKTKFTKEKIYEAAFAILNEKGWAQVSARSIAKVLEASTMLIVWLLHRRHVSIPDLIRKQTRQASLSAVPQEKS